MWRVTWFQSKTLWFHNSMAGVTLEIFYCFRAFWSRLFDLNWKMNWALAPQCNYILLSGVVAVVVTFSGLYMPERPREIFQIRKLSPPTLMLERQEALTIFSKVPKTYNLVGRTYCPVEMFNISISFGMINHTLSYSILQNHHINKPTILIWIPTSTRGFLRSFLH